MLKCAAKKNIPRGFNKYYTPGWDDSSCNHLLQTTTKEDIDPVVEPKFPREKAGFRRGRSTVDQLTLLTQYIEDSFQHNVKPWIVFLDLTAAHDNLWHRGLHLTLFRTISDIHMVGFIMEMLSNRSFVVYTSNG